MKSIGPDVFKNLILTGIISSNAFGSSSRHYIKWIDLQFHSGQIAIKYPRTWHRNQESNYLFTILCRRSKEIKGQWIGKATLSWKWRTKFEPFSRSSNLSEWSLKTSQARLRVLKVATRVSSHKMFCEWTKTKNS